MENKNQYNASSKKSLEDNISNPMNPTSSQKLFQHHLTHQVQDNDSQRSFSQVHLGHLSELEYSDDQRRLDSISNDQKSPNEQSELSHQFAPSGLAYTQWGRRIQDIRDGDRYGISQRYLDVYMTDRPEDGRNNSSNAAENGPYHNVGSGDLTNVSNEEDFCNDNDQLNDVIDLNNESIDSYQSNKLNETYSISQDGESDYSIGFGMNILEKRGSLNHKPKLRDLDDPIEREKLFEKHIDECCKIYDFRNDQLDDLDLRDGKMVILSEFFEILVEEPEILGSISSLYDQIFRMFSVNVFRPFPPSNQNVPEFDPEEDEPPLEPSWPHLQLVYHVLLRFTNSPLFDPERAKNHINEKFIVRLLQLFESEDPRERSYLKSILHRIYGQYLSLRAFIRRQIGIIFSTFIYENEYHNGIADLLEILGSIINGYVIPLKEEHKVFLMKVLMPLHKARTLSAYHAQLSICVVQHIEKDPKLAVPVVNALLRYWPKVHSTKEVMFLNQIEEILDIIDQNEFRKIMNGLFKQLARCLQSYQFQVAERVLYFWNNEYILSLINDNVQTIFPLVVPALYVDPKSHWNKTIHGLTYNVLRLSTQMNQKLFHDLVQQQDMIRKNEKSSLEDKNRKWRKIRKMAQENATKMNYQSDHQE